MTDDERAVLRALYGARGLTGLSVGDLLDHRGTLPDWPPARVRVALAGLKRSKLVRSFSQHGRAHYRITETGVIAMRQLAARRAARDRET